MNGQSQNLKELLLQTDEEFHALAAKHHALEDRLHELTAKHYLSEPEQIEEVTLKKQKLQLKDRMEDMTRRSALVIGLAATSATIVAENTMAQPYAATEGKELAPGVREVALGKRQSMIPAYKTVSMRDVVYQPKAKTSNPAMTNDMVCHCAEGELRIKQGPGMEFVAKKGDVWSCNKGLPEDTENIGSGVSIMRVIDFDRA